MPLNLPGRAYRVSGCACALLQSQTHGVIRNWRNSYKMQQVTESNSHKIHCSTVFQSLMFDFAAHYKADSGLGEGGHRGQKEEAEAEERAREEACGDRRRRRRRGSLVVNNLQIYYSFIYF